MRRMQPGGEIMERAAKVLKEAVTDAAATTAEIRAADGEATRCRRLYEDAMGEIKTLRESDALCQRAIAQLQEIAGTKKGAAAKARDWLISVGRMPPAAPAEVEAPKTEAAP